jgi:hypothetical protein
MDLVINKNSIKRFLGIISLSGEHQIREALITIKKDSISCLVKSPTNTIGISAVLKGKFTDMEEIGIDDLSLFESSLGIQDKADEVAIKIKENKLSISSNKTKASLILRKPDYIKNKPKEEDFNKYVTAGSGNEFTLLQEDISKIMKAYNLIKSDNINIFSDDGKSVKFRFGRMDNEIETEVDLKNDVTPFKTNVNSFILFILNFLGEATISINQDNPTIVITSKKDNLEVTYIVAISGK